jgi:hypothetical protein
MTPAHTTGLPAFFQTHPSPILTVKMFSRAGHASTFMQDACTTPNHGWRNPESVPPQGVSLCDARHTPSHRGTGIPASALCVNGLPSSCMGGESLPPNVALAFMPASSFLLLQTIAPRKASVVADLQIGLRRDFVPCDRDNARRRSTVGATELSPARQGWEL